MKFFKLCSAITAFVFYVAAVCMFWLPFLNQVIEGVLNGKKAIGTGFQIAFKPDQLLVKVSNGGTLAALIAIGVGLLASVYAIISVFLKKGKKKANPNLKLLCASCSFAVCGLLPVILLFLTKQTGGFAFDHSVGFGSTKTVLGVGAILSAIFTLIGAGALGAAELK